MFSENIHFPRFLSTFGFHFTGKWLFWNTEIHGMKVQGKLYIEIGQNFLTTVFELGPLRFSATVMSIYFSNYYFIAR